MTEELEDDVRRALHARAEAVTPEAIERVTTHARRAPHQRVRRRTLGGIGVGALATIAGVVAAVVVPGAATAYADWSPAPTSATVGQVPSAETQCATAIVTMASAADAQDHGLFATDSSAWSAVIEDVRGPYTLIAYVSGTTDRATCLANTAEWTSGPELFLSGADSAGSMSFGGGGPRPGSSAAVSGGITVTGFINGMSPAAPGSDDISQPIISSSNSLVTFLVGFAGSSVSAVSFNLSDGTTVDATVSHGYYAAWWPSNAAASTATVTSSDGTTTQPFAPTH